ncbi:hypothetical protein GUITHDRAFT_79631 [Guillardia theta CCMP2712]|uniref:GOST seven transmembrane domain-containing protein n=1 Tax=Guillardia theta (strain CCMP2712) TaxID=905079 RepID=L1IH93_GUITC|nr:hypothetical protein GUITHDRAFT_79631 [Guillardia theta CCMP2712]EKX35631.1 hypothetical protein GUITHDRAFT_79631 [Guillardia theta CCMP2712]|eukprot:XP_005822611.1 hypothetical protein GUITHDRAFT_79631 [Guillardia theta CCMP2712]
MLNTKKPNDVIIPIAGPNTTYTHQIAANGKGLYSILYSNCNYGSKASFQIHYVLMNKDGIFISEGEVPLPLVYAGASLLFLFAFVYWVYMLRTSSSPIHKIQYLMGLLCFFKAASVGFEAFRYQSLKSFGDGYAWATLFHILTFVKGTMLFAVILLIGTGWSIMKPFLADREKRIILIVLPMQVLVNVAMVVVDETPPGTAGWMTWRDILHFFDAVVCCCAILFPIVWSIKHLRDAAEADGKAKRILAKLKMFREFYVLVVCYIYFSRIIIYLVKATLPCELSWVASAISETASLIFYMLVGYKFRPDFDNPYLMVQAAVWTGNAKS